MTGFKLSAGSTPRRAASKVATTGAVDLHSNHGRERKKEKRNRNEEGDSPGKIPHSDAGQI